MLRVAATWQGVERLHVDVHGCRDPPHTPSHLTIGLGAMLTHAQMNGTEQNSRVIAFGQALEEEISAVLTPMRLRPRAELIRIVTPASPEEHTRFAGAWAPSTGRHTQTQQAVSFAGIEYSLQLEMSK